MTDCINYRLPQIPYLQLRFKLSAQQEAHLPRVKGVGIDLRYTVGLRLLFLIYC